MYGRWNPELNGVSVARNPVPGEDGWKRVVPVRPPLQPGQTWVDPTYSMGDDGTIYETWVAADPADPGVPTVSVQDLRSRLGKQTTVVGLKAILDDLLAAVDPTDPTEIVG